ncbi:hypothetical protein Q5P01_019770 [Channa striata]|uniref:V-set and immunoglobulin domain-containing protein 1 n=1 Tax=Channa striata TaxID=64152 RepID=A0AA88M266_CHASR|nr:hypothetical protein Q5P01_019770 [Channa striata]
MCSTLCLLVLINIIGCVELITVSTPHKYINVTKGDSVQIQCTFQTVPETKALTIEWNFVSSSSITPQQVSYYQSGETIIAKAYQGRLQPFSSPATTSNATIILSNMQSSDSGVYTCEVHNFPDVSGKSQVNIFVKVLEKPSDPYCAVHGDVEAGHLVTLTCHSERGSPSPMYKWTRLDHTMTSWPVLGRTTTTGILEITNISQFEFGTYQCNATNAVGFSTCNIDLTHDPGNGVIAGAVIGALLGCVLIILVVWFIAHNVKKHKYKAVKASEAKEMKRQAPQAQETAESVPVATTAGSLHAEVDEPQA